MGIYETWLSSHSKPTSNVNTSGLNQGNLSTTYVGGSAGKGPSWNDVGWAATAGTPTTQYKDDGGGTWSNSGKGWESSTGQKVNDLAGYLKMKDGLKSGSDFSGYKAGLDSATAGMNQASQQYQQLLEDPNRINETAGYQFAVDQGNQAINRSAAAKGQLNSGNVLAELAKYGQGMGSQLYQQQLGNYQQNFQNQGNRVNSLSGLMQGAQQFGLNSGYYNQPASGGLLNNPNKPSMW